MRSSKPRHRPPVTTTSSIFPASPSIYELPPPSPPPSHYLTPPATPDRPPVSLLPPSKTGRLARSVRAFRVIRSALRSFPIFSPACNLPHSSPIGRRTNDGHIHGGVRMTGTLFGPRKGRISLAIQDNPGSLPILLLDLPIPTTKLLHAMGSGLVRIAMECEKRSGGNKTRLVDEPVWTMYCNGRKTGYGCRREASEEDLHVMQLLRAVSMGAGVVPAETETEEESEGEVTYMRAHFERVVGSRDSETYYMMNPDGNSGAELSIFFVRI